MFWALMMEKGNDINKNCLGLLSDSGMLEVMEELVEVRVLTEGGRPGNSPVRGNTTPYYYHTPTHTHPLHLVIK